MNKKILIIEDEPGLVFMLQDSLQMESYEVFTATDGNTGIKLTLEKEPDLILLDIMLPEMDGWDVCRTLRNKGIETPIIMLTVKNQLSDKVLGFKLGADDYITKPFSMIELLSRIEARLRRSNSNKSILDTYTFGNVNVDFRQFKIIKNGKELELSTREFKILEYFIKHKNELITRDQLLTSVWNYDSIPNTRTIDMHISKLRYKIEDDPKKPEYLITIHWAGYKFVG